MYFNTDSSQRPQPQIGDRHQVDGIDSDNSHKRSSTTSLSATTVNNAASTSDELGPLPAGWQVSKTETGRIFFIDHINKRTTWVRKEGMTIKKKEIC